MAHLFGRDIYDTPVSYEKKKLEMRLKNKRMSLGRVPAIFPSRETERAREKQREARQGERRTT